MKHAQFLGKIDNERILTAIADAEKKTTGQIRVFISRRDCPDPLAAAQNHFKALGMAKTELHNAILFFIAPKSRTFAIYGDTAIHAKCGPAFWDILRDEMSAHLKEARYTDALVHAITKAGELLATHFPAAGSHPNEQPNDILED